MNKLLAGLLALVLTVTPAAAQVTTIGTSGISQTTGTWTPTLTGSGTAGTQTYSEQVGNYTKTGLEVVATFQLRLSAISATGNLLLTNLPFTSANTNSGAAGAGACTIYGVQGVTYASSTTQMSIMVRPNSTTGDIYTFGSGATFNFQAISGIGTVATNALIYGTCSYQSAS